MKTLALLAAALLAGCASVTEPTGPVVSTSVPVAEMPVGNPAVGGVAMPADRTIAVNAAAAPNLSTLVGAVAAAGLTATLNGPGPYTVFAPTNEAFGRLAPGTVDALLRPENKASLVKLLTYHIVPGALSGVELIRRVAAGGGRATLTTIEGEPLTVSMVGSIVALTDGGGNKSYIETADVRQANGVVHVVNGVLIPTLR